MNDQSEWSYEELAETLEYGADWIEAFNELLGNEPPTLTVKRRSEI